MKYIILPENHGLNKKIRHNSYYSALTKMQMEVENNLGNTAIYMKRDKRVMLSYVVIIYEIYEHHVVLQRRTFDPNGNFRGYIYESTSWPSLFCSDDQIRYPHYDV